jgi:hypothetical protein
MCRNHNCPYSWRRALLIALIRIALCWWLTHH